MHTSVMFVALWGLLAKISIAALCTTSNAIPIQDVIGSGTSGDGLPFSVDITDLIKRRSTPTDPALANAALPLGARAQRSLSCTAAEICASDLQGKPFCYNVATGGFHDADNTVGNLITGEYTLADGRRGNLYTGPFPGATTRAGGLGVTTAAAAAVMTTSTPRAASRTPAAAGVTTWVSAAPSAKASANGASGNLRPALGGLLVGLGARLL